MLLAVFLPLLPLQLVLLLLHQSCPHPCPADLLWLLAAVPVHLLLVLLLLCCLP
jgi:hypothetical protein